MTLSPQLKPKALTSVEIHKLLTTGVMKYGRGQTLCWDQAVWQVSTIKGKTYEEQLEYHRQWAKRQRAERRAMGLNSKGTALKNTL